MDVTPRLRPGSIPIVRGNFVAGTLYTVPAGRRLVILAAWVMSGAGTMTVLVINAPGTAAHGVVSDSGTLQPVVGASANSSAAIDGLCIPVLAGTAIDVLAVAGAAPGGGFSGYEYTPTGPEEV